MCIPPGDTLLRRADARSYLFEKCPWYPCHTKLETCNMCFCVFYPCEDERCGEYVTSGKGTKVWSCMDCNWAHSEETVDALREFLRSEGNRQMAPKDMYMAFVESRKTKDLRRRNNK